MDKQTYIYVYRVVAIFRTAAGGKLVTFGSQRYMDNSLRTYVFPGQKC